MLQPPVVEELLRRQVSAHHKFRKDDRKLHLNPPWTRIWQQELKPQPWRLCERLLQRDLHSLHNLLVSLQLLAERRGHKPQRVLLPDKVLSGEGVQSCVTFVPEKDRHLTFKTTVLGLDTNLQQLILVENRVIQQAKTPEALGIGIVVQQRHLHGWCQGLRRRTHSKSIVRGACAKAEDIFRPRGLGEVCRCWRACLGIPIAAIRERQLKTESLVGRRQRCTGQRGVSRAQQVRQLTHLLLGLGMLCGDLRKPSLLVGQLVFSCCQGVRQLRGADILLHPHLLCVPQELLAILELGFQLLDLEPVAPASLLLRPQLLLSSLHPLGCLRTANFQGLEVCAGTASGHRWRILHRAETAAYRSPRDGSLQLRNTFKELDIGQVFPSCRIHAHGRP
mmetsp:Transcript_14592/g.34607  ORF Transcript_14592/g.34607 Transcript_14592/m.34607 type:complete len:392 (-) Transcript_14592:356-1531(-)